MTRTRRIGKATGKPSRTVTAKCVTCARRFAARRSDAVACSGRCRQRALRARQAAVDIDVQIEEARRRYWKLVRLKATAQGVTLSHVVTAEAQFVDEEGDVFMHGERVGTTTPVRPGWAAWGLEAAPAPWRPPPGGGRA